MSVQVNFDANTVDPSAPVSAVPAGTYIVCITNTEQKATRAGDGHYLKVEHTIQDGEYKGRKIFDNLNLWNKNETAARIAWADLSAICHAVGILQVQDTAQLHGQPHLLTVTVEHSEEYGDQNRVKSREPLVSGQQVNPPAPPAPPTTPPAPPTQAANPTPPPAPTEAPAPAGTPPWAAGNAASNQAPATGSAPPWAQGGS